MTERGRRCPNPPEFLISVTVEGDEYMVGVTCGRHKDSVSKKIKSLQKDGKIPAGRVGFGKLRSVGTDCIKGDAGDYDDLVKIG